MKNALRLTMLAVSVLALAGCAGGGGGGGSNDGATGGDGGDSAGIMPTSQNVTVGETAPSSVPSVMANGTNTALTQGIAFGLNGAAATTGSTAPNQVSAQMVIQGSGSPVLQVTTPGGTDTVAFGTPSNSALGAKFYGPTQGTQGGGKYTYNLSSFQQLANLTYSDFGIWDRDLTSAAAQNAQGLVSNDAIASAYYRGAETPLAQMPPTGTFTYNGSTVGASVNTSGGITSIAGDIALTANFAAATINGSVTNLYSTAGPLNLYGDLAGSISGNSFSGTGLAKENGATVGSGGFSGKFFGPAAQEVAGQWNLEGSGVKAMGSFGAKR